MFKKDNETSEHSDKKTIIAQGVRVEGDFTSQGDVIIEGEVFGNVSTEQNLQVGETAKIHADVAARNATVSGEIKGNLTVLDNLELSPSSVINGDVYAKIISMSPGSTINGRLSMGGAIPKKHKKLAPRKIEPVPVVKKEVEKKETESDS